ncbi:MAG: transposase [Verrucomicrobia bacterium]|nr:transposase [Verrucomicrobiota bacterium]
MTVSESISRYDLLVSLDRSDRTAALALFDLTRSVFLTETTLDLAPEALDAWWRTLLAAHPSARIAVAFEQPAPNLLAFFAPRQPAAIYALNPSATWAYRQSLTVSRARNDQSDARDQALFVKNHLAELTPWTPPPLTVTQLERVTLSRRKQVDARTALTNQLQAALKRYFPQALALLHEDLWRPMNLEFLRKWPSAQKLKTVPLPRLQAFYQKHGSRSVARWTERSALVAQLVPLAEAGPADELEVSALVDQIEVLNASIRRHDQVSAELLQAEGAPAERIAALPGAGPTLAPRLYVALARHAPNCTSAEALAAAVGVAPVTDQSGKMHRVYRRLRCDNHTRQSFVEWAKESWKHSAWAEAFVRQRQEKGQGFHAIIRALAYKWVRILWKCWRDGVAYQEERYLETLRQKGSPLVPKTAAAVA